LRKTEEFHRATNMKKLKYIDIVFDIVKPCLEEYLEYGSTKR
jgi:hypothetical protein